MTNPSLTCSPDSFLNCMKLLSSHCLRETTDPDTDISFLSSPSWLLQDPNMKLRTTYRGFTKAVDLYFDHLMSRVVPLQVKEGRLFDPFLPAL